MNQLTPKLRFPEFKDEWETVLFENIFKEENERTNDIKTYPLYSLTVEDGVTPKSERYERSFLIKKDEDNYKIVNPDNFVYNPMNLTIGAVAKHKEEKSVSVSGYYNVFRTKQGHNSAFFELYLKSHRMISMYKAIATGSLIEKQRVHYSQFIKLKQPIPSLDEQNKIGEFFSLINQKIDKQQEKIEQLEVFKKGMMQKVFSKEFRFKNDNGQKFPDWKETTIGSISTSFSGGTPKSTNSKYYNGNIPFIRSGEINSSKTELFISQEGLENSSAKLVNKGDLLMALYGANSGEISVSKIDGAINQAILCIRTTENINYVKFYWEYNKDIIVNTYLQGGQGNLSGTIVKSVAISLPSLVEQQKISDYLSVIDLKIEKEKEKLDSLMNQKKGFMQQMLI